MSGMSDEYYETMEKELFGKPSVVVGGVEKVDIKATTIAEAIDTLTINDLLKLVLPYAREGNVNPDNGALLQVVPHLLKLQNDKEATYGSSWCKRGEMEVFFNLSRKFDRIEKMMLHGSKDKVGEPIIETIADLGVYCLLWVTLVKKLRPDEYNTFVKKIYADLQLNKVQE